MTTTSIQVPNPPAAAAAKHPPLEILNADDFYNAQKPAMDPTIVYTVARQHGIEPEVLLAFAKIESPRGAYMADGRPYILYEAHVFSRLTSGRFDESHPTLSSATWNRKLYGAGGGHQYDRLYKAMELDQSAALKACSWGAYQILGDNHKLCGFDTVEDFVQYMVESEANQFDLFIRFLLKRGIMPALRAKDWDTAFFKYNGPAFRDHGYDTRFLQIYQDLTSNVLRSGASGADVTDLQKMLVLHGQKVDVTGIFGAQTEEAVKQLQKKWGLTVDGVVGTATYKRLAAERVTQTGMLDSKRGLGAGAAIATGATAVVTAATDDTAEQAQKAENLLDQLKNVQEITGTAKQVVISAKDATQQVKDVSSGINTTIIVLGFIIIVVGIYIYWTKFHDKKKVEGVTKRSDDAKVT